MCVNVNHQRTIVIRGNINDDDHEHETCGHHDPMKQAPSLLSHISYPLFSFPFPHFFHFFFIDIR